MRGFAGLCLTTRPRRRGAHRSFARRAIILGDEARLDHLVGCVWFWVWALVDFGLALGAVSLGPILTLPLGLLALRLTFSETARRSAFGLLTGAGSLCLFVAWLQQGGDSLDARPWLASGLAFTLIGVLAHARHGD